MLSTRLAPKPDVTHPDSDKAEMVVSQRTVEWHVANLLGKLGLETKAQLAVWAHEHAVTSAKRADGEAARGAPPSNHGAHQMSNQ